MDWLAQIQTGKYPQPKGGGGDQQEWGSSRKRLVEVIDFHYIPATSLTPQLCGDWHVDCKGVPAQVHWPHQGEEDATFHHNNGKGESQIDHIYHHIPSNIDTSMEMKDHLCVL